MTTADAAARSCIQPEAGTLCTVEIRIGIKDVARELVFETDDAAADIEATVVASLDQAHLALTDAKGKRYVVPSSSVAYVEIGTESTRKIGFVA